MTSATAVGFDLSTLPEVYGADQDRIRASKKRQADVWAHRTPDRWPILFGAPLTERQESIPKSNLEEAFNDKALMLCSGVTAGLCAVGIAINLHVRIGLITPRMSKC